MAKRKADTSPKNAFLILLMAGLFLIGAAAVLLYLPKAQQQALAAVEQVTPVSVNYAAPSLTLTDVGGSTASLADFRGHVVLVNNWATWCPPCTAEMPTLQAYYEAHAAEGFVILAIEAGEPASQVAAFVDEFGLTFPVWLDPRGAALHAFQNWNLPSSYVIDRDGIVRLTWTGAISRNALETYVTPLLEK